MRSSIMCVAALFVSILYGCGGLEEDHGLDREASSALGVGVPPVAPHGFCSAVCAGGGIVSCSGVSCFATDGKSVNCDGVVTHCPALPPGCTATLFCESLQSSLSCSGTTCAQLDPLNSKVCGGVKCDGVTQLCPPLPGDLECN